MQAQTGRPQRFILNRLTLSLGLAVILATAVVIGVTVLEVDLPYSDDGEAGTTSQTESRIPATAKTAWDYGDVEADLQTSAGSNAAAADEQLAIPHRPGLTSTNLGEHRATTMEMGGVLYLEDEHDLGLKSDGTVSDAVDAAREARLRNLRLYDLNAVGAQDPGPAEPDSGTVDGYKYLEENITNFPPPAERDSETIDVHRPGFTNY